MKRILFAVLFLSILFFSAGWVNRSLTIETDPKDADIYFDDNLIGKSPVKFDFMWYAKHRIRIEKKGYYKLEKTELIKAPFFMYIPLDLVSEALPIHLKDERKFSYKLFPREEIKFEKKNP